MNNTDYPKYSVLMSVYYKENPEWFQSSIASIFAQTVQPDEFILIEDGPLTPELDSVAEQYRSKYPSIFKIVPLEKNGGLGPAHRLGVEKCSNEYKARMDSDDYCKPNRIEKELDVFLQDPTLGMVGTNVIEFIGSPDNCVSKVVLPETYDEIRTFSKKRNPFRHPSIIFKKSAVLAAGNYREYYLFEDYDMWVRMIRSGCKCYNIQEFLTYMRISDDFYKRRGGIKYLKSIYRFKKEQYAVGYVTYPEFLKSFVPHAIVCLMPNTVRDYIYRHFLRK